MHFSRNGFPVGGRGYEEEWKVFDVFLDDFALHQKAGQYIEAKKMLSLSVPLLPKTGYTSLPKWWHGKCQIMKVLLSMSILDETQ